MKRLRVAFDIGGVVSKYPAEFKLMIEALNRGGAQVFVISDMKKEKIIETLRLNKLLGDAWDEDLIDESYVFSADYDVHGEGCKAILLEDLEIDMFFDDFIGYAAAGGCPIRLLVMPDASKPYWHEEWKTPDGDGEFGRRKYSKREAKR